MLWPGTSFDDFTLLIIHPIGSSSSMSRLGLILDTLLPDEIQHRLREILRLQMDE
jgi:hypothetical protein